MSEATITIENREKDTWHLPVYEADNRHIKFTVILGRSDDRDQMIAQDEGPAKRLPSGRAFYEHKAVAEWGIVHAPTVELTASEWEQLLASHNGPLLKGMIERQELLVHQSELQPRPTRRRKEPATA